VFGGASDSVGRLSSVAIKPTRGSFSPPSGGAQQRHPPSPASLDTANVSAKPKTISNNRYIEQRSIVSWNTKNYKPLSPCRINAKSMHVNPKHHPWKGPAMALVAREEGGGGGFIDKTSKRYSNSVPVAGWIAQQRWRRCSLCLQIRPKEE